MYDIDFTENDGGSGHTGNSWKNWQKKKGMKTLHRDAAGSGSVNRAEEIHANNVKRVIRALEFYHQTGEKISEHNDRRTCKKHLPIILPILS